jgi:hypothetical protein
MAVGVVRIRDACVSNSAQKGDIDKNFDDTIPKIGYGF